MFAGIFGWALKLFSSGVIKDVMGYLQKRADAAVETHKTDAQAATQIVVAQMQAELEVRKEQDKLAQPHDKLVSWIGAAFVLHIWMITLDTCFHLGWGISALPGAFGQYEIQFLCFLIGAGTLLSIGKAVVSRVWK